MEKYKKIRELGEGGFGTAYLVERISDGVQFVIKEINVIGQTESELNSIEDEAIKMINLRLKENSCLPTDHLEAK